MQNYQCVLIAADDYLTAVDQYIWSRMSPERQTTMASIRQRRNTFPVVGPRSPVEADSTTDQSAVTGDAKSDVEACVPHRT
jgi:hypothetical protein